MYYIAFKYFITAFLIVFVSEIAKRSDKIGAVISSFPLVTILILIWLYVENQDKLKIQNHAYYTFWYVIPTLPMFILFPFLYDKLGFWMDLFVCLIITAVIFIIFAMLVKKIGIELL
jgi:hypothetical protein